MSGQFGTFDGLDNRRQLFELFRRLGHGLTHDEACARRGLAIQHLLGMATCPTTKAARANPMTALQAYAAFTGITGVLGAPIDAAAIALENEVRKQ